MNKLSRVLVTNDDGIDAPGLAVAEALAHELCDDVWTFAPTGNRSGASQALSPRGRLAVTRHAPQRYGVSGTPADCVMTALGGSWLDGHWPDLVISGVNWGGNLSDSVMYSGTVGAALAGAHFGIPALAFSQAFDGPATPDFAAARAWMRPVFDALTARAGEAGSCWNVNFPGIAPDAVAGLAFTRDTGGLIRAPRVTRDEDHGDYRLSFERDMTVIDAGDGDVAAIRGGFVSAMPLTRSRCDGRALDAIGAGARQVLSADALSD